MKTAFILFAALLTTASISATLNAQASGGFRFSWQADQQHKTPGANSLPDAYDADAAIVDEINAIRSRLGGGIAKQLEGVMGRENGPETTDRLQQDFDQHLRVLNANHDESTTFPPLATQPQKIRPSVKPGPPPVRARNPPAAVTLANARRTERLRNAARCLEQAAAELEFAGQYTRADQIREHAQQVWVSARKPNDDGPHSENPPVFKQNRASR